MTQPTQHFNDLPTPEKLGQANYAAYGLSRDYKDYAGLPLKHWNALSPEIRAGWIAGALEVVNHLNMLRRGSWPTKNLVYRRVGGAAEGGRVKISTEALAQINLLRQVDERQNESGGVLIGRYIQDSDGKMTWDIIIDEVTIPMEGDTCTPKTFDRSAAPHQAIIDKRWNESGGRFCYLGEWHTHAEYDPLPSELDIASWEERLTKDIMDAEGQVFMIVGQKTIGVWEGDRGTKEIRELELVGVDW